MGKKHSWVRTEGTLDSWHCTECSAWTRVMLPEGEQELGLPTCKDCPYIPDASLPPPCEACGRAYEEAPSYYDDWCN